MCNGTARRTANVRGGALCTLTARYVAYWINHDNCKNKIQKIFVFSVNKYKSGDCTTSINIRNLQCCQAKNYKRLNLKLFSNLKLRLLIFAPSLGYYLFFAWIWMDLCHTFESQIRKDMARTLFLKENEDPVSIFLSNYKPSQNQHNKVKM